MFSAKEARKNTDEKKKTLIEASIGTELTSIEKHIKGHSSQGHSHIQLQVSTSIIESEFKKYAIDKITKYLEEHEYKVEIKNIDVGTFQDPTIMAHWKVSW